MTQKKGMGAYFKKLVQGESPLVSKQEHITLPSKTNHHPTHQIHKKTVTEETKTKSFKLESASTKEKERTFINKTLTMLCVGSLLLLIILISYSAEASPMLVIIGFLPAIIYLMLAVIIAEEYKNKATIFLWAAPFILSAIFLITGKSGSLDILTNMDVEELSVLNLIIGLVFASILQYVGVLKRNVMVKETKIIPVTEKKHTVQETKKPVEEKSEEEQIAQYIISLEDKIKGINFSIGRVYRKHTGATETMRKKIRISRDLYNEFSNIKPANIVEKKEEALWLVKQIYAKLDTLMRTEKFIFGDDIKKLKQLKRNIHGNNKIIDVLEANDSDPVKTYFEAAVESCQNAHKVLMRL